jgi:hypothetical protein
MMVKSADRAVVYMQVISAERALKHDCLYKAKLFCINCAQLAKVLNINLFT